MYRKEIWLTESFDRINFFNRIGSWLTNNTFYVNYILTLWNITVKATLLQYIIFAMEHKKCYFANFICEVDDFKIVY